MRASDRKNIETITKRLLDEAKFNPNATKWEDVGGDDFDKSLGIRSVPSPEIKDEEDEDVNFPTAPKPQIQDPTPYPSGIDPNETHLQRLTNFAKDASVKDLEALYYKIARRLAFPDTSSFTGIPPFEPIDIEALHTIIYYLCQKGWKPVRARL